MLCGRRTFLTLRSYSSSSYSPPFLVPPPQVRRPPQIPRRGGARHPAGVVTWYRSIQRRRRERQPPPLHLYKPKVSYFISFDSKDSTCPAAEPYVFLTCISLLLLTRARSPHFTNQRDHHFGVLRPRLHHCPKVPYVDHAIKLSSRRFRTMHKLHDAGSHMYKFNRACTLFTLTHSLTHSLTHLLTHFTYSHAILPLVTPNQSFSTTVRVYPAT